MSTRTTKAAHKPCPRKCLDCEELDHHWGEYEGERLSCKHCPAAVKYTEKCARCGHELVDHVNTSDGFECGYCTGDPVPDCACYCEKFTLQVMA